MLQAQEQVGRLLRLGVTDSCQRADIRGGPKHVGPVCAFSDFMKRGWSSGNTGLVFVSDQ